MVSSSSFGPEPWTSTIAGTFFAFFGIVSVPGRAGEVPTAIRFSSNASTFA